MGAFGLEHWRSGVRLRVDFTTNTLTVEGVGAMLQRYFSAETRPETFYVGLISSATTILPTDTLASHPGWEECTSYSGGRKPLSYESDQTNLTLTNSPVAQRAGGVTCITADPFVFTRLGTIAGVFVTSASTGNAGVLVAVASVAMFYHYKGDYLDARYRLLVAGRRSAEDDLT